MSYRIEYDSRVGQYEIRRQREYLPGMLMAFGVFLLLTCCFWPSGAEALRSLLIPGDDAVTVQAFSSMTDDLRSGAGLREAVEGFCRWVIHGQ